MINAAFEWKFCRNICQLSAGHNAGQESDLNDLVQAGDFCCRVWWCHILARRGEVFARPGSLTAQVLISRIVCSCGVCLFRSSR